MKQRYTVVIPYDEPRHNARTYVARIEVSAVSEMQAKEKALDEFKKLERMSSVQWTREVHEDSIAIESVLPAGRPSLQLHAEIRGDAALVTLDGIVDEGSFAELDAELEALFDKGHSGIVIDCSRLDYITSSGIGTIVSASSRGAIRLCGVQDRVRDVFDMVGLSAIVQQFDNADQALRSFE